ncbi:hypothetical protein C8Q79DRAFT_1113248 [Trametes meyenii]|nr:hypothetical protein C8Q79DRAFT_1113248 [Trametes meyenii]
MNISLIDTTATLLNGHQFVLRRPYTESEARGVLVLAVVSCISATSVAGLLLAMAVSAYNTRKLASPKLFVRSHVAVYFTCMLLCEVAQTIGSIMNLRWYKQMMVTYETYCTVQGVLKHVSDVGTAYWYAYIIAVNTFWILFLRWRLRRAIMVCAFLGGWSTISTIVTIGPGSIQQVERGPFYAISGYWCWIQDEYPTERITLDYMIMFLSALLSFVMYILIFLNLRGNISLHGWRLSWHSRGSSTERCPKSIDTHAVNIAKGMLLYPIVYVALVLPIAISRFTVWLGHEVPFAITIACDSIFLLSGFVNVVLFLTTRRVLPVGTVFPSAICRLFRPSSDHSNIRRATPQALTDIEKIAPERNVPVMIRYPENVSYPSNKIVESEYDLVSLNSAAPESEGSWEDGMRSTGLFARSVHLSPNSPSITVAIPSSTFNPFEGHPDTVQFMGSR